MSDAPAAAELPTSLLRTIVRYVVGFGVGFAVGIAPFLGVYRVPFFAPLLDLYPVELAGRLIPASSFLMGMVALTIQFAAEHKPRAASIRRAFKWMLTLFLASFLALIAVYPFVVARIEKTADDGRGTDILTYVTGTTEVPRQRPGSNCACLEGQAADQCIEQTSVNPTNIKVCFGTARVARATVALALLYLITTACLPAGVGLLVLRQRTSSTSRASRRGGSATRARGSRNAS